MDWVTLRRRLGIPRKRGAKLIGGVARAERALGVKLPASYRQFVEHLGLCRLGHRFIVWTPSYLIERSGPERALVLARIETGDRCSLTRAQLDRLIPCGRTDDGDLLAWLPARSSPARSEWPVIVLTKELRVVRAGPDLQSFVAEACFGRSISRALRAEPPEPDEAPPPAYQPIAKLGPARIPTPEAVRRAKARLNALKEKMRRSLSAPPMAEQV